ncbi:MAG: ABC transporter ATP-binding protein [Bacilli bacterium]|nr:ABC transporter ATP-binding protein [Bacilli bacterium]
MKLFKSTIQNLYKIILMIVISSAIISFFNVVIAKFIVYIVDGIVMNNIDLPNYLTIVFYNDNTLSKIIVTSIFMIIMTLIISVFNYIRSKYNTKLRLGMNKNIKNLLLKHTTYLDYNKYVGYENSQILQRVSGDSSNYIAYINDKLNLILNTIFYTFFSLNVIIELNFKVCLILSIIILIIVLMSVWYCINTKTIVNKKVILSEGLIQKTMNSIYNPKMIKMTNNQNNEINKFNDNSEEYLKYDIKEIDYLIYYELIASGIKALSSPIIYLVCGIMIINGNMQIGGLMAILTYSTTMLNYFQNVIYAVEGINSFLVPAKRIKEFFNLDEENLICKDIVASYYKKIEFRNVNIQFDNQVVFENLNFTIKKGENVYLVGSNGSGKSVLTKLLLGFIPYEGNIFIDDIELRDLHKTKLRENIGLCFQTPYIFSDTIKNNIDCFENKKLDEIRNICKICELDKEIENFSSSYDELLGERGINLSGGQKQRINIARLLIQNKKILIFDDVLSKLDNNTKNKIVDNLNKNYPDNINIFITHDLLRIPKGCRVLFIDNKTIIDSTNTKLEKDNKNYKKLIDICENVVGGSYE